VRSWDKKTRGWTSRQNKGWRRKNKKRMGENQQNKKRTKSWGTTLAEKGYATDNNQDSWHISTTEHLLWGT